MAKNRYLAAGLACTLACAVTQQVCAEPVPSAYQLIAAAHKIPPAVLYAVATQESNRRQKSGRYRPWPWTLNVAGKSYYYNSRQTACTALHIALKAHSAKNIDVGIAQINVGWNPDVFSSPCDGLDPYANLNVAAKLLRTHHNNSGSWAIATGLYHYPAGGPIAARYQKSVQRRLAAINPKHLHETLE